MKFIVFEGLDGSGKSSLMQLLETEIHRRGLSFIRTREPGGTELGDEIRHLILRKERQSPTARTELLLYEAIRAQHVECVIAPALARGAWVLCDRYVASSHAFQAGGRAIASQEVEWLNHFATQGLKADLTILLDVSVGVSRKRRQSRSLESGEPEDRIESEKDEFHEKVRQSFLQQAKSNPTLWLVLDAQKSIEELYQIMIIELKRRGFLEENS